MNLIPSDSIPSWVKRVFCWVFSPKGGLIIFLVVLFAAFVAVMCCEDAEGYIGQLLGLSGTEGIKNQILTFLGLSMGGILLALQAVIANRRAEAMENAANAQAKANENAEKGQRQERLKNAIEHLGHDSVSIRLGGAYELFHLAQDTEELRQTVLDILCSHIRRTTTENDYKDKHSSKPSEEIQSLLTLLFVQEHEVFKGLSINLQGSWLNGAKLKKARLEMAVLDEARLWRADLSEAQLLRATLEFAYLQNARFAKAQMQKTDLSFADLQEADFSEAQLQGAIFYLTCLQNADFLRAYLQGSDFSSAKMQGAALTKAHMEGTDLSNAHLEGAYIAEVQFQAANLDGLNLRGATCREPQNLDQFGGNIRSLSDKQSDLSGAIFAGGLTQDELDFLVADLSDNLARSLLEKLRPHVGKPVSHELPKDSGAIIGSYTEEEAKQWIAEYEQAMSEVTEKDDI